MFGLFKNKAGSEDTNAEEVQKRLAAGEKLFVLDVREPHEFQSGHIPGARLIPLGQLPGRLKEIPQDAEIVAVCRSGNRSGRAAQLLRSHGYTVQNMRGGMLSWRGPTQR